MLIKNQFGQGQTWGQWKSYQKFAGCESKNRILSMHEKSESK